MKDEACSHWNELLNDLAGHNVKQAVIACTDLNVVLPYSDSDIAFIDSTDSLAKAVVNKYLSEKQ